ncbi:hypothetical protein VOLCADRAFT_92067 [Volvox carteri f. nagariensis]|uniref:Endonuclease/exonuclease/phosphatase domain-containing protein n=1 Tax=Volvox carteri f. nagariensis TaxID=3068 RepID=D8TZ11_VOLCA|nr:uncharacterized protein VOLCADRAFT_92067 [Volvox carteri f. nagariensis]EFJ47403.1 hypothetical protein VOLCADRAFT_92067 [Volvox carteri f. nagariensis]|eukprot:XP_002951592.1 hypothetical protein VOLCADRAFT_92067 [Volvox carteri f. nagariensis]
MGFLVTMPLPYQTRRRRIAQSYVQFFRTHTTRQIYLLYLYTYPSCRWNQMLASPALTDYAGFLQLGLVWHESRTRALLAAFTFWDGLGQQQLLYVANMHLEGSPYRPNDRISQTRSALQRLEAHQRQYGIAPEDAAVVVCGDFNSGRHETVCHFLHRGRLEGGTTEPHMPKVEVTKASISHPYALHEAYSSGGHELPFTRKVQSGSGPGSSSDRMLLVYVWLLSTV